MAFDQAKLRESPSTGAQLHNFRRLQTRSIADAAFNGRPLYDLQPSPISIYEPAFGRFVKNVNKSTFKLDDFSKQEYDTAIKLIEISSKLFADEDYRHEALSHLDFPGTGHSWKTKDIPLGGTTCHPDGGFSFELAAFAVHVFTLIKELKNGKGEGKSDGSFQTQCYYRKLISSDKVSWLPYFHRLF